MLNIFLNLFEKNTKKPVENEVLKLDDITVFKVA